MGYLQTGASFEGAGGSRQSKEKKEKTEEKKKKRKKRKKRKKEWKRTMNNVKLLHIKCYFFNFVSSIIEIFF